MGPLDGAARLTANPENVVYFAEDHNFSDQVFMPSVAVQENIAELVEHHRVEATNVRIYVPGLEIHELLGLTKDQYYSYNMMLLLPRSWWHGLRVKNLRSWIQAACGLRAFSQRRLGAMLGISRCPPARWEQFETVKSKKGEPRGPIQGPQKDIPQPQHIKKLNAIVERLLDPTQEIPMTRSRTPAPIMPLVRVLPATPPSSPTEPIRFATHALIDKLEHKDPNEGKLGVSKRVALSLLKNLMGEEAIRSISLWGKLGCDAYTDLPTFEAFVRMPEREFDSSKSAKYMRKFAILIPQAMLLVLQEEHPDKYGTPEKIKDTMGLESVSAAEHWLRGENPPDALNVELILLYWHDEKIQKRKGLLESIEGWRTRKAEESRKQFEEEKRLEEQRLADEAATAAATAATAATPATNTELDPSAVGVSPAEMEEFRRIMKKLGVTW